MTLEFASGPGPDPTIAVHPMTPRDGGWFEAEIAAAAAGQRYRFRLPDGRAVPDPASRAQSGGVHGWSVLDDAAAHVWTNPDWRGRPWDHPVL